MQHENYKEEDCIQDNEADEKIALIDALGSHLSKLAAEQVTARIPIERRWLEDIRQFQGKYGIEQQTKIDQALNGTVSDFSDAFVNATRNKTNAGESIIGDLLFPNDQKNWGIESTPVPQLIEDADSKEPYVDQSGQKMIMEESGEPVTAGNVVKRVIERSKEKAEKMERQIEDQFIECDYNGNARDAIHYAAMLGTGILKGPVVQAGTSKIWQEGDSGQWEAEKVPQRNASVKHVNPFHIFPDMTAATKEECEFIFEVAYPTRRQMQDLAHDQAIIREQLIKVLNQGPSRHITQTQYQDDLRAISGLTTVTQDKRFELWSFRGPLDVDLLKEVGAVEPEREEDPLNPFYGVVWFAGSTVIKVQLNPNGFEEFPYHFYSWEKDHASLFGYGVPYLMRQSQRAINVAWRQMLDNSSNTAGPQIVIDKSLIEPEDGSWEIKPFKVWTKKRSSSASVNDAFSVFSFNNHQQEIAGIYNMAQEIADQESGIPKLVEGQQGKVQTLGEASLQQNNANNDTRRRVREWDDNVTKPLLKQMYDWNMRYNTDPSIKGDFKIKATGSSTLLAREQNQQALIQVASQIMPNPQFAPFIKTSKILQKLIQSFHLDDTGIIRTDDEVRKIQEQEQEKQGQDQQDPNAQIDMAKIELKKQELEFMGQRLAMEERIELMKLAQSKEMTLEQLDAKLKEVRMREQVNLHKFNTEVKLKLQVGEGI